MKKKSLKYVDKSALVIMIIILALMLVLPSLFLTYSLVKNDIETIKFALGSVAVIILFILALTLTQSHGFPLKMHDDKIFLAPPSFPSFGRKEIPLRDIKSIRYSCGEKWDEKGDTGSPRGDDIIGFIRAEDIYGNKYRNVFFKTKSNLDTFKRYINELVEKGMIDKDWLKNLSPMLKP